MSKLAPQNLERYIHSLILYSYNLLSHNYLGKVIFQLGNYPLRQLLFRKHRILYYIQNKKIQIVSIVHTSQNLLKSLSIIQKYFSS